MTVNQERDSLTNCYDYMIKQNLSIIIKFKPSQLYDFNESIGDNY